MKALLQRVTTAAVTVDGDLVGSIDAGLLVLLGVERGDTGEQARQLADKTAELRIFNDDDGKMNLSVEDTGGAVLVISQFTLAADTRRGRRPSYARAADPEDARELYERYQEFLRLRGLEVASGRFGAMMRVSSCNDGPVTILLERTVAERS